MAYPFGRPQIIYRQLLACLRDRHHCTVVLQDAGGIRDTDGSESGALYLVTSTRFQPLEQPLFAFIEVFNEGQIVLREVLESVCSQLGLNPDDVAEGPAH